MLPAVKKIPEEDQVALAKAQSPNTTKKELKALSRHPNFRVRMCVAEHSKTAMLTQSRLSHDSCEKVREMAMNKRAHAFALLRGSIDYDWLVRVKAADAAVQRLKELPSKGILPHVKRKVLLKTITNVALDSDKDARRKLLNSDLPPHILDIMAWDPKNEQYLDILEKMAKNPNAGVAAFDSLSCSIHWQIRAITAISILKKIDACKAEEKKWLTEILYPILFDADKKVVKAILDSDLPYKILDEMARSHQNSSMPDILEKIALHKNTPLSTLEFLSKRPEWEIVNAVAMNQNISPELLAILSKHPDFSVQAKVAANEKTPQESLADAFRKHSKNNSPSSQYVISGLAANRMLPPSIKAELMASGNTDLMFP